MRPVVKPLLAVALALALAGVASCSDDNPETTESVPDTSPNSGDTEPPATAAPRQSDGVLTIGVLLPQTGPGAPIGIPGSAAASSAVAAINDAGGVLGEGVVLVTGIDEGETLEQAGAAVQQMLDADVDAIVGPGSSAVALEYLDDLMSAGVLTCSPTANALALEDFPDRDLFFRTITSDSRTADGIALQAARTGVSSATVVYVDDGFGRPMARAVMDAMRNREVQLREEIPLTETSDYAEIAAGLAESDPGPGTIILIADSEHGWAFLNELQAVLPQPPAIIVNDALRSPPSAEQVAALPEAFRLAIEGVSPLGSPGSDEPAGPFATNSFDCVNLIALSALAASTDDPEAIAAAVDSVANGGAGCPTFAECAAQMADGRNILYTGPRQRFSIGRDGDPDLAQLMLFRFDDSGLANDAGPVRITD